MGQIYLNLPPFTPQDIQRFWSKVDIRCDDECWPWIAGKDQDGYGTFRMVKPRRMCIRAHRIAYFLRYGEDPWPLIVRHLVCDNPSCCNGAHLAKGTINDNNQDSVRKNRRATGMKNGRYTHPELVLRGTELQWTKLTEQEVLEIRRLYPLVQNYTHIGKMFSIHKTNVKHIVTRRTWKHI